MRFYIFYSKISYDILRELNNPFDNVLFRDMSGVETAGADPLLSGGLAMALAYINRVKADLGPAGKVNPRSEQRLFSAKIFFRLV